MKKLIPIFLAVLCLTACGNEQVKNPDTLSTAVISSSDSVTAKNTLNSLNESTVATLTADKIDASNIGDLSDYDVLYFDKSVVETGGFMQVQLRNMYQTAEVFSLTMMCITYLIRTLSVRRTL